MTKAYVVEQRSAEAIRDGLRSLFANPPDRGATRRYAERFSWDETSRGQERVFESLRPVAASGIPCKASS